MLRISVRLDPGLLERGELLAEAGAMEAAGVDTLWLPEDSGGLDGAVLLAGLAGSVRRVLLGLDLGPQHAGWKERVRTLQLLSRGRLVLASTGTEVPPEPPAPWLARRGPVAGAPEWTRSAGFIHSAMADKSVLAAVIRESPDHEHWIEGDGSQGRVAWRALRESAVAAGATGIIVPHHPVVLDLLRNPEDEDERSDLQMATG